MLGATIPRAPRDYGDAKQLRVATAKVLKTWVSMPHRFVVLTALFMMAAPLTVAAERFPILRFTGDPQSGKSRVCEAVVRNEVLFQERAVERQEREDPLLCRRSMMVTLRVSWPD